MNTADKKAQEQKMRTLLEKVGVNVTRLKILGAYVHIDTFQKYDAAIRHLFAELGAQIRHLPGDVAGRHLDGSTAHRLVAKF